MMRCWGNRIFKVLVNILRFISYSMSDEALRYSGPPSLQHNYITKPLCLPTVVLGMQGSGKSSHPRL